MCMMNRSNVARSLALRRAVYSCGVLGMRLATVQDELAMKSLISSSLIRSLGTFSGVLRIILILVNRICPCVDGRQACPTCLVAYGCTSWLLSYRLGCHGR